MFSEERQGARGPSSAPEGGSRRAAAAGHAHLPRAHTRRARLFGSPGHGAGVWGPSEAGIDRGFSVVRPLDWTGVGYVAGYDDNTRAPAGASIRRRSGNSTSLTLLLPLFSAPRCAIQSIEH